MKITRYGLVLATAFAIVGSTTLANPPTARLIGTVAEPGGLGIPSAQVTVDCEEPSLELSARSALDGTFQFVDLPPGECLITASRTGFLRMSELVVLAPGDARRIEIHLPRDVAHQLHERVMVVGGPEISDAIPGSAAYLDAADMTRQQVPFGDIHRYLRRIPGVYIQEEEGFGLRPNIGMRGAATERSSNITLMEDGVLVAPAPYAAPAAYYFPVAARMKGIEVRKGSSQIKYGPRTHGGALNLVSTPIPDGLTLNGDAMLGTHSTRNLYASLGDSRTRFGWLAETYQIATDGFKRLDTGGNSGYEVQDYLLKFRLNSNPSANRFQQLELKFGRTLQNSNETYLGLTDEDFRANLRRRYAASQRDVFTSGFRQIQARHFVTLSPDLDLTTTAYSHRFGRNWYKLGHVRGRDIGTVLADPERFPEEMAIIRGGDSEIDALTVRANNRDYFAHGVETLLGLRVASGSTRHSLEVGLRYHEDQEDRFQHDDRYVMADTRMTLSRPGAPGSQSNQINDARAWALFTQDRIEWSRWTWIPGLRYERIELIRTDFAGNDPLRESPLRVRSNSVNVLIPGLGVQYDFSPSLGVFGGLHRGFAPPGPGSAEETLAERSVNCELGARWTSSGVRTEVVGFLNRYANLLGRDTLSSGGAGTGDLYNGGAARVRGLETSLEYDLRGAIGGAVELPLRLAYTLTHGEFRNSFKSDFAPWGDVLTGDEMPYLPRHLFYAAIGMDSRLWSVDLESSFTGRMRTNAGQGPIPVGESTDSHLILNVTGRYLLAEGGTRLFVSLHNLTDSEYIAARSPAGVRSGLPRTLMAGVRFHFGK
jgi:Fe(3+) dicitrate transport protein